MTLVETKSLTVRRGATAVLEGVDLTVARGEMVLVLGPNGAGKSTLARAVLGLVAPSSGTVSRERTLKTGYVPQSLRRDPTLPLSTLDFVRLTRAGSGDSSALFQALGIGTLLARPVAQLSGGELRRAALARALLHAPDLLVLDEPLAGVDAASQDPIYELIASYAHQHGTGVLLIAHEVLTAIRLADKILCLDRKALACGPPPEIAESTAFIQLFGPIIASSARKHLAQSIDASRNAHG